MAVIRFRSRNESVLINNSILAMNMSGWSVEELFSQDKQTVRLVLTGHGQKLIWGALDPMDCWVNAYMHIIYNPHGGRALDDFFVCSCALSKEEINAFKLTSASRGESDVTFRFR